MDTERGVVYICVDCWGFKEIIKLEFYSVYGRSGHHER